MYYTYVHARPNTEDASGIFYVGKGTLSRAMNVGRRNPHHANIVKKHGKENILVGKFECSSEAIAFELEKGLIKCLRRMGVGLTNQTDGGEGISGLKFSPEARLNLSRAMTGRSLSEEHKAKIGNAGKGRKHTQETILKLSQLRMGKSSPRKGKTHTAEARSKLREANLGKEAPVEAKEKMRAFWVGRIHINNGTESRRVLPDEIPEGWVKGRLVSGKIWATNGIEELQFLPSEVPEGFTRGRLARPQRVKAARKADSTATSTCNGVDATKHHPSNF